MLISGAFTVRCFLLTVFFSLNLISSFCMMIPFATCVVPFLDSLFAKIVVVPNNSCERFWIHISWNDDFLTIAAG